MMAAQETGIRDQGSAADRRKVNRSMFWRVLRRSVFANRGRLFVILLALGAGSAVTAALLNLQVDARQRVTSEFRSFGANVLIGPADAEPSATLAEELLDRIPGQSNGQTVPRVAMLFTAANVTARSDNSTRPTLLHSGPAVLVGLRFKGTDRLERIIPYRVIEGQNSVILDAHTCEVGEKVASQFHLRTGADLEFVLNGQRGECLVSEIRSYGGVEDNQIFVDLAHVQKLAQQPNQISVIALSVGGRPGEIERYVAQLQQQLPAAEIRLLRQFTEGEARLYGKISDVLTATVMVVLVLTALCVMAAMTNVAMERKNDVGLMKAIGGSVRRVLRIFLAEAALLGLAGGLIGAALGILLSMALGKAVFGVAAEPRLVVYPVSVGLTVVVAVLASYPLRRLAMIRPASVFRGEE